MNLRKHLLDSDLENDAVEGLSQFENKKDPVAYAKELNRKLQTAVTKKETFKGKRRIKELRVALCDRYISHYFYFDCFYSSFQSS